MQGLDAFSLFHRGGKAAGNVRGDVQPAHRNAVEIDKVAFHENPDTGDTGPHFNDHRAEVFFIIDQG